MAKRNQKRLALLTLVAFELMGAGIVAIWLADTVGDAPASQMATIGPPTSTRQVQLPTATATQTPESRSLAVRMSADLPAGLSQALREWADDQAGELLWTNSGTADLTVDWENRPGSRPLAQIVLVPVAPFSSLRDSVSSDELRRVWSGQPRRSDTVSRLIVSAETAAALNALFGPYNDQAPPIVAPTTDLADRLWAEADALAVVPFDQLEPQLKVLTVDDLSALDRDLDPDRYPLAATVWVKGPNEIEEAVLSLIEEQGLSANRHLDRLTVVAMTGVTALTRHVAQEIDRCGDNAWPARRIASLLSAADLTHVSNEVSFMSGCQVQDEMPAFCARPEYMAALQLIGTDLVELTGNHNLDLGPAPALQSLELYAREGMRTFGGGQDVTEAHRPLLVSHNGNRLAFLGYNQFGPDYAWATWEGPGAAPFSLQAAQDDVAAVRPQADIVFVNIQYTETYDTTPLPDQVTDFRAVVEAGADVVTGSQAHQPQTIEFYEGGSIFYGLGNLFFDQVWSEPTTQSLVVYHYVYDGRLIAAQLLPTVITADFQTRPANDSEKQAILQTMFDASGW